MKVVGSSNGWWGKEEAGVVEIGVVGIRKRKTAGKRGDPLMRKQW